MEHKLIGKRITGLSIDEGFIELDNGQRLYLDEDEVKILKEECQ